MWRNWNTVGECLDCVLIREVCPRIHNLGILQDSRECPDWRGGWNSVLIRVVILTTYSGIESSFYSPQYKGYET